MTRSTGAIQRFLLLWHAGQVRGNRRLAFVCMSQTCCWRRDSYGLAMKLLPQPGRYRIQDEVRMQASFLFFRRCLSCVFVTVIVLSGFRCWLLESRSPLLMLVESRKEAGACFRCFCLTFLACSFGLRSPYVPLFACDVALLTWAGCFESVCNPFWLSSVRVMRIEQLCFQAQCPKCVCPFFLAKPSQHKSKSTTLFMYEVIKVMSLFLFFHEQCARQVYCHILKRNPSTKSRLAKHVLHVCRPLSTLGILEMFRMTRL